MVDIGDKVRFLNDVGGGVVKSIKAGGVAMVEDEDGFDIPCLVDDLVVIETNEHNVDIRKFDKWHKNDKPVTQQVVSKDGATVPVSGKVYLAAKNPVEAADEVDENLEARIVRLEMLVAKLTMRLERLEDAKAAKEKKRFRQSRYASSNEMRKWS